MGVTSGVNKKELQGLVAYIDPGSNASVSKSTTGRRLANAIDQSQYIAQSNFTSAPTFDNGPFPNAGFAEFTNTAGIACTASNLNEFKIGSSDFTFETWFNISNASPGYIFRVLDSTSPDFIVESNVNNNYISASLPGISLSTTFTGWNQWHHVAVVKSGDTFSLYIDGSLEDFASGASGVSNFGVSGNATFDIGSALTGKLSNLRVIKTALYTESFIPPLHELKREHNAILLTCQRYRAVDDNIPFTYTQTGTVQEPYDGAGSVYFDGVDDYLQISSSNDYDIAATDDYTIEAWILPETMDDNNEGFISLGTSADSTNSFQISVDNSNGNRIKFSYRGNTGDLFANCSVGVWQHVAATRENGVIRLFVNGVQGATTTQSTPNALDKNANYFIGRNRLNNKKYNGYISNIRITKSALYTANFTPPTYFATDEFSDTVLHICHKTSLTNPDQTKVGNPIVLQTNGINFDGTDDMITIPVSPTTFTDFTVAVWFYPRVISSYDNIIDCNFSTAANTGNIGPRLEIYSSGKLVWVYSNSTDNNHYYSHEILSSGLLPNRWHYAVISYDHTTNTSKTYLDGVETSPIRSSVGSPSGFYGSISNVTLGRGFQLSPDRFLPGHIGSVSLYNRQLSDAAILSDYNDSKLRFQ